MDGVLRGGVRLIDRLLSNSLGVYIFTDEPDCILRIQYTQAAHSVIIGNERILKGEPILGIHVWNERMPKIPAQGATLDWALEFRRRVIFSFREIAKEMRKDPKYEQARALYGASVLFSFSDHIGGIRVLQRLGFTVLPYQRSMGKFGIFWENLFSWWLMWTYNTASMNSRQFFNLQRTEIWMLADEFLRRYGTG